MNRICPNCFKRYKPELSLMLGFEEKYEAWQEGTLVQNVWPTAAPILREQLVTGICSDECLDQYLGLTEEDPHA